MTASTAPSPSDLLDERLELVLVRQDIWNDAHGRREDERQLLANSRKAELDEKRGEAAFGTLDLRDVRAIIPTLERLGLPNAADRLDAEVARGRVRRFPHLRLDRLRVRLRADRAVLLEGPLELRPRGSRRDGKIERRDRLGGIAAIERVVGVRDVAQMLLAAQIVEIELRRVGKEELIPGGVDDVLRKLEAVAVG